MRLRPIDEAALSKIWTAEESLFLNLYNKLLADKKGLEVLLQTYFGDMFVTSTLGSCELAVGCHWS